MKSSGTAVVLLVMVAALAGCAGGASSGPVGTVPSGNGIAVVKVDSKGRPVESKLSDRQKQQIYSLARRDPLLSEMLKGRNPEFVRSGYWTGKDGILFGATMDIQFGNPGNYFLARWPVITNTEDVYGIVEDEGSRVVKPPKTGAWPEIGTRRVIENDVKMISILYDLKARQVADVTAVDSELSFPLP